MIEQGRRDSMQHDEALDCEEMEPDVLLVAGTAEHDFSLCG